MRRSLWFSLLAAAGTAACASSPSSGGGAAATPAPAAQPAAAAAAGGANPCAGGCRITVSVEPSIADIMQEKAINYRVFAGCPRSHGGGQIGGGDMRAVRPLASSRLNNIEVPAFQGRYATIMFLHGTEPQRIAVVDFTSANVTVKSPWISGGPNGYQIDDVLERQRTTEITRCR